MGLQTGAGPRSPLLHVPARGAGAPHQRQSPGRAHGESVSVRDRNETCRLWSVRRLRLVTLVGNLVPAFLGRDPSYFPTFLGTYRAFGTPQQVLDLLLTRYGCILAYYDEDGGPQHQLKM
ncbi:ral guanine nucleotide dissociation stimulator-like [Odocoileus virginianus]|uniref:Ral guanine nucleotide dissociation stimulator-like n=1 Tax=Odocoileus virginianus TaxID=9874 RepID=A0ABM4HUP8_ODOVR